MKLLLQFRSKKQTFWKKLWKIAKLKMKICCFIAAFYPTSATYQPVWNYVSGTASNNLLTRLLILQPLQHASPAHFHCRRRRRRRWRRLQPHLLLIVYHQNELPRCLLCLRIPIRTTRFISKCHPSGAHPNPTNTQWIPKCSVCHMSSSNTKFM